MAGVGGLCGVGWGCGGRGGGGAQGQDVNRGGIIMSRVLKGVEGWVEGERGLRERGERRQRATEAGTGKGRG